MVLDQKKTWAAVVRAKQQTIREVTCEVGGLLYHLTPWYILLHLTKLEYCVKVQGFFPVISESDMVILCRDALHRVKYFKTQFQFWLRDIKG